ncbi:MAG: hypothetical protein K2X77_03215 [Candidatus Obscuribacterales bacterium]|jgi:hypothetical protein|nr:hypothetical protein [Candidatus Obscuribacterales bacterium]
MKSKLSFLLLLLSLICWTFKQAAQAETDGIGWIPTWKQAQEEAAKKHKPILLVAAAPQCAGVPGVW